MIRIKAPPAGGFILSGMSETASTPYQMIGGEAGVRRLADAFYDAMEREPTFARLRALHAADLTPMRARLSDWLVGWMGGPRVYFQRHPGRGCVVSAHAPIPIGAGEAAQWMACMRQAFDDARTPPAARSLIDPALATMCQGLRNDG